MKEGDDPGWTEMLTKGGAVAGAVLGYVVIGRLVEQTGASPAEAGGRAMAGTIVGIIGGTPTGAALGFAVGKFLDFLDIKH